MQILDSFTQTAPALVFPTENKSVHVPEACTRKEPEKLHFSPSSRSTTTLLQTFGLVCIAMKESQLNTQDSSSSTGSGQSEALQALQRSRSRHVSNFRTNHGRKLNSLLTGCNLNTSQRPIFHLVLTYSSGHKSISARRIFAMINLRGACLASLRCPGRLLIS